MGPARSTVQTARPARVGVNRIYSSTQTAIGELVIFRIVCVYIGYYLFGLVFNK